MANEQDKQNAASILARVERQKPRPGTRDADPPDHPDLEVETRSWRPGDPGKPEPKP